MSKLKAAGKIGLSPHQKIELLSNYARKRVVDQLKTIALIIIYLILFQTFILFIPIKDGLLIALGLGVTVLGLAFFMEGLFLGLMPLSETIGLKLPRRANLVTILGFAFILGVGATLAEPAIGILKQAGSFVKAWDAPLLFFMLNKASSLLVWAVGIGVGLAVLAGMLRFFFNWSLKPFLYIGITLICVYTVWAHFNPNLRFVLGLAWDSGGVTTGPVTVPLVLALGIGICRIVSSNDSELSGFGVVTLASLFPIFTVLTLGVILMGQVPQPMAEADFFAANNHAKAVRLFEDEDSFKAYAIKNAAPENIAKLFKDKEDFLSYIRTVMWTPRLREAIVGTDDSVAFDAWFVKKLNVNLQAEVLGSTQAAADMLRASEKNVAATPFNFKDIASRNAMGALQAVLPLVGLLFVVLLLMRERVKQFDEVVLGILFAVAGMFLFNIGIELGLSKLGNQVGQKVPASFKQIVLEEDRQVIPNFTPDIVQKSIDARGHQQAYFEYRSGLILKDIPYQEKNYNVEDRSYLYVPTRGPLFGNYSSIGYALVLLFAFILGFGATLAEPALNALGVTVEELSVGTFKKSLLMNSVAIGVGTGMAVGLIKIIWDVPLAYLLIPPYILLLILTFLSTEEYVNIGWDSAGVTTGPITVPLVLSLGLGISSQVNAVEGFGILAVASCYPIIAVLSVGLWANARQKKIQGSSNIEEDELA